jgi:hypothetical protein
MASLFNLTRDCPVGSESVFSQNLPKVFFGKGSKGKVVTYLGNGTFGRFLLAKAITNVSEV